MLRLTLACGIAAAAALDATHGVRGGEAAKEDRALHNNDHWVPPPPPPPPARYLNSYVPCAPHDGACGFWSVTENKWIICSDQAKCRHYPGCDPRGECDANGQYCALVDADADSYGDHHDDHHHRPRRHKRRHGKGRGKGRGRGHKGRHHDDEGDAHDYSSDQQSNDDTSSSSSSDNNDSSNTDSSSSSSSDSSTEPPSVVVLGAEGNRRQLTSDSASWGSTCPGWQPAWGYWTHPYTRQRHQCEQTRKYLYCQPCTATCYTEQQTYDKCRQAWPYWN